MKPQRVSDLYISPLHELGALTHVTYKSLIKMKHLKHFNSPVRTLKSGGCVHYMTPMAVVYITQLQWKSCTLHK